ncbi:MAG: hypothetical protein QXD82_01065 [Nitrososphaerales archaeon]
MLALLRFGGSSSKAIIFFICQIKKLELAQPYYSFPAEAFTDFEGKVATIVQRIRK